MKDLHLQEFTVESFLGIDKSSPIVIDFTQHKSKGVTIFKGDQGVGKTSTLTALMLMMGATFDIESKNFINLKDETTKVDLKFMYDGSNYHAVLSGNRLSLKKQYKEAGGKWIPEGSPKEMLRMIFGNLGVSPMALKTMDGKKQIEWFKKTFGKDEDAGKKELKAIADLKNVTEERKNTNREIKSLKGWLDVSDLYNNYEKSQKKFATPVNADKEKKKLDELATKKNLYEKYENTVTITEGSLKDKENEILQLEAKLAKLKEERESLATSLETGNKWLVDNKGCLKEYEVANNAWLNLSKTMTEQNQWKEVLAKEKEYNELLEKNINENAKIDSLRTELLKITKSYLPEVEGLEVRVKISLDDEDEGIYLNDLSMAQISESEIWGLFIPVWKDNDVRFIICENTQDLGSEAVKNMNKLIKEEKVRFFGSEMERGKKDMEVSFTTKIE